MADEGIPLVAAERWMRGELPYRDFFEFVGPADLAITALGFQLLGTDVYGARMPLVLAGALLCAIAAWAGARTGGWPGGVLAFLWLLLCVRRSWPLANHGLYGHLGAIASLAFGVAAFRATTGRAAAALFACAGLAAGWTVLTRIHLGTFVLAAGVAALATRRERRGVALAAFAAFGAAPILLAAAVFALGGAADDWFASTALWPLRQYVPYNQVEIPFETLAQALYLADGTGPRETALAIATILVPALLGVVFYAARRRLDGTTVWLGLHAIAWIAPVALSSRGPHLLWAAGAGFVALAAAWSRVVPTPAARIALALAAIVAAAPLARVYAFEVTDWFAWVRSSRPTWQSARGPWTPSRPELEESWRRAGEWLKTRTTTGVLFFPFLPLGYFATGCVPPVRSTALLPGYTSDEDLDEAARAVAEGTIRSAVADASMLGPAGVRKRFPGVSDVASAPNPVLVALQRRATEVGRSGALIFLEASLGGSGSAPLSGLPPAAPPR